MRRFLYYLSLALCCNFSLSAQEVLPDFKSAVTRPANLSAVVEQNDGKIIVAGTIAKINNSLRQRIARLEANGTVDPNFTPTIKDTVITCLAIQSDQKILAGGYWDNNGDEVGIILRLQADGSIDPTFQADTFNNRVLSIEALSNQRIAVGGIFRNYGTQSTQGLVLLNNNGSLFRFYNFSQGDNILFAYDILEVGSQFYVSGNIGSDAQLYRFDLNGQRDNSFTIDKIIGDQDFMTSIQHMDLRTNGNLTFTTYTWEFNPQVITINSEGNRVFQQSIPNPLGLTVNQQDQILISGQFEGRPDVYLVSTNGLSPYVPGEMADDQVYDLLTLSTGNIIAIGRFGNIKNQEREAIALFSPQRTLINSFQPKIQRAGLIRKVIVLPDQKLLIAGDFTMVNGTKSIHLARLNQDGSLDQSFQQTTIPSSKSINTIHRQSDGKILVGTSASSLDPIQLTPINRLNSNGSKDNTFQVSSNISLLGNVNGIKQLPDNRIVIHGSFSLIDPSGFYRQIGLFDLNGTFIPALSAAITASSISDILVKEGNLILAGNNIRVGSTGTFQSMVSVSPNGVLLNNFSTNFNSKTRIEKLFPLSNGDILVSGRLFDGNDYRELTKLKPDGSIAPDFQWPAFSSTDAPVNAPRGALEQGNQNIILSNLTAAPSNQLFVMSPNGSLEDTLVVQSSAYYNQIIPINDSTSYLSGAFTLDPEQISITKVRLFGTSTSEPIDTTPVDPFKPSFYLSSDSVQIGASLCLTVSAEDLKDLLGIQLTLNYDPSKLQFESVGNFVGLPGLSNNDFGVPGNNSNNAPGEIRMAWLDPNLSGFSLMDSTALFDICFTALEATTATTVTIIENELVNNQEQLVNIDISPGNVEITLIPDTGGGDPDTLYIKMEDATVKLTEDVCIPVRVKDFEDIMGLQFNLNYDPSKLQFKSIQNFNLPDLNLSSFGIPGTGANPAGRIKLAWFDLNVSGVTIPDETILFEVCFTALAGEGNTEITYSNQEVTREVGEIVVFKGTTSQVNFLPSDNNNPDPTVLSIQDKSVRKGDQICVPILVDEFDDLIGLGFTLNFDPSKLAFESVGNFQLAGLSNSSFELPGSGTTPTNQLVSTWFDFSTQGVTLADQSAIFEVCFTALSDVGSTEISFSSITVVGSNSDPRPFDSQSGTISLQPELTGNPPLTITVSSDTVELGDNFCVQLKTEGFDDILGLELTVDYNPDLLDYESAGNFNLSGLSTSIGEPGTGNNPPGKLKIAWFDQQVEGITLVDGTVLFEMCFTAKAKGSSSIDFSGVEVTGDIIDNVPFIGVPGDILIEEEVDTTEGETYDNDNFILSVIGDTIPENESFCVPIRVKDFNGIKKLAFDFFFDPNLLEYTTVINPALPNLANQVQLSPGNTDNIASISINWTDQTGNGANLDPDDILMEVCFKPKGAGISLLAFGNANVVDNNDKPVPFQGINAFVTIEDEVLGTNFFTFRVASDTVQMGQQFCLDVSVDNFEDILGLKLNINYDPDVLTFESIGGYNLKGLDARSFDLPGTSNAPIGQVKLSWIDQDLRGVTLPDGTVIFQICFTAKVENSIGTVSLSNPNVLDSQGNVLSFVGIGAIVMVEETKVTSVKEIEQAKDRYRIYPVPTGPELTIEALKSVPKAAPFQIFNAQGQRLILGQINGLKQIINLQNLSPGYYNLIIQEDSGYWSLPFIKL